MSFGRPAAGGIAGENHGLHAIEDAPSEADAETLDDLTVLEYYRQIEQDAVTRLRAVVPDAARVWARPEERVVKGRAHQEILKVVADEGVDLIVMGVQGKGIVNRLVFGSTTGFFNNINWLETAGRADGPGRRATLKVNNAYGLRRAVEAGLGIASLPDYIIGKDSQLVQIQLPAETPEFDTYFVYPEELRDSKRVGVFRDFLVSKAKEWSF